MLLKQYIYNAPLKSEFIYSCIKYSKASCVMCSNMTSYRPYVFISPFKVVRYVQAKRELLQQRKENRKKFCQYLELKKQL